MRELRAAVPRPVPTLFRFYVIANGLIFHVSGKTAKFLNGRWESFQTKRGMTIALERAGFRDIVFNRPEGRLIVQASASANFANFERWGAQDIGSGVELSPFGFC